jgi:hypothetical protein
MPEVLLDFPEFIWSSKTWDSVVRIVTTLNAVVRRPYLNSQQGTEKYFLYKTSKRWLGPKQNPIQWVPGPFLVILSLILFSQAMYETCNLLCVCKSVAVYICIVNTVVLFQSLA